MTYRVRVVTHLVFIGTAFLIMGCEPVQHSRGAADVADQSGDIENEIDISLLIADRQPTEWTKLCLRHADRVLLVADDRTSPALTEVETDASCSVRLGEVPLELVMSYEGRPRTSDSATPRMR